MKVVFPSLSENERFARIAVSGFLSFIDPKVDELADIKTAVSEAVTNCIVHGYRDTVGKIEMSVKVFEDNTVKIRISDKGCGIENIEEAMQPLFTTKPDEDRAGLGFAVMESFMDKLKVTSKPGKGTAVTLEKKIAVRSRS
jgi:stage II sporulation protein AB (anti-sigma F factor)